MSKERRGGKRREGEGDGEVDGDGEGRVKRGREERLTGEMMEEEGSKA